MKWILLVLSCFSFGNRWSNLLYGVHGCKQKVPSLGRLACSPKSLEKFRSWTRGRGEETLWSSGWTLIGSELSSPNFNSSVRAKRSFAIRYLNAVIKPLRSRNSVRVLSVADRDQKWKMLLSNLADFATEIHFGCVKPEHASVPIAHSAWECWVKKSVNQFLYISEVSRNMNEENCGKKFCESHDLHELSPWAHKVKALEHVNTTPLWNGLLFGVISSW